MFWPPFWQIMHQNKSAIDSTLIITNHDANVLHVRRSSLESEETVLRSSKTSDESTRKTLTRGDSIKALQHKYQQATGIWCKKALPFIRIKNVFNLRVNNFNYQKTNGQFQQIINILDYLRIVLFKISLIIWMLTDGNGKNSKHLWIKLFKMWLH